MERLDDGVRNPLVQSVKDYKGAFGRRIIDEEGRHLGETQQDIYQITTELKHNIEQLTLGIKRLQDQNYTPFEEPPLHDLEWRFDAKHTHYSLKLLGFDESQYCFVYPIIPNQGVRIMFFPDKGYLKFLKDVKESDKKS